MSNLFGGPQAPTSTNSNEELDVMALLEDERGDTVGIVSGQAGGDIVLQYGTEEIIIPSQNATDKSIGQLFDEHSFELGMDLDATRINYRVGEDFVPAEAAVSAGATYTAAIRHDTKGSS